MIQAPPQKALTTIPMAGMALASLPEEAFTALVVHIQKAKARVSQIKQAVMKNGSHYGTIPGTPKPTLLQPGAQVLLDLFGLHPELKSSVTYGDGTASPEITVISQCLVHSLDLSGPVMCAAEGACTSWEKKYRMRSALACPECGGKLRRSRQKEEWYCWDKDGGCGSVFPLNDQRIMDAKMVVGANPDAYDLLNTLVKMSNKRALVAAALLATNSSDEFTQDLEEGAVKPQPGQQPKPAASRPAPQRPAGKPGNGGTVPSGTPEQRAWQMQHARMLALEKAFVQKTGQQILGSQDGVEAIIHADLIGAMGWDPEQTLAIILGDLKADEVKAAADLVQGYLKTQEWVA